MISTTTNKQEIAMNEGFGEESRIGSPAGQSVIEVGSRRTLERVLASASIGATAGFHATKRFGPVPAAVGAGAGAAVGIVIGWLWE
jgi:hypothetical protein